MTKYCILTVLGAFSVESSSNINFGHMVVADPMHRLGGLRHWEGYFDILVLKKGQF